VPRKNASRIEPESRGHRSRLSSSPLSSRDVTSSPPPTIGYRRLALLAVALTFLLVIVGGIVRVSDSGLGCGPEGSGTDGWPLCGGRVVPLINANMVVEYSHRVLAGTLAVVIGALALIAWRRYRDNRALVRVSAGAFCLVLFQAALGGLTVEKGLKEELVATHLGIAMVQIGLLILLAYLARAPRPASPSAVTSSELSPRAPGGATRALAIAATAAVLGTIVAGGYMSASELHGTGKQELSVHTACGTEFPSCNGSFLPFGGSRALDIHLTHRAFMYLASTLVLVLFALVVMQGRGRRALPRSSRDTIGAASVLVGILVVQVMLGALNVWLGEHAWLVVVHLTVGTLLWCWLVFFSTLALGARRAEATARPRDAKDRAAEALPA
jgi:heme A synthase